jgi:hypothetical protein
MTNIIAALLLAFLFAAVIAGATDSIALRLDCLSGMQVACDEMQAIHARRLSTRPLGSPA